MSACQPSTKSADTAADEAAVRKVLDEMAAKFNAVDFDGELALYSDDFVISAPGKPDVVGKDGWIAGPKVLPPGVKLKMRFDTQEMEVAGDLAYARGTFLVEAQAPASDAYFPVTAGRYIHMFKRQADGSWKLWRRFENSADPG